MQREGLLIDALVKCIFPLWTLWAVMYLALVAIRKRLPFYEADIVEVRLCPMRGRSRKCLFAVGVRLPLEAPARRRAFSRDGQIAFAFTLRGHPGDVRDRSRYERLSAYYTVGSRLKMHYLPHFAWLFGFIPDSPVVPPLVIIVTGSVLLAGTILGITYLQTGSLLP
jgi:hypothetical protein